MAFKLDFTNDVAKFAKDFLETVTLSQQGEDDVTVEGVLREPVSWKEAEPVGGGVQQGDIIFHLPIASVKSQPSLGSRITDASEATYTVLSVTAYPVIGEWACTSRNLVVTMGLTNAIRVEKATYTKDPDSGEFLQTWQVVYSNIRAKVQSQTSEAEVRHEADWAHNVYRIIIDRSLEIDAGANYRILDKQGNIYLLDRYEQTNRIDVLPAFVCHLQTILSETATTTSSSGDKGGPGGDIGGGYGDN